MLTEVPVNTAYGALTHRPRLSPKVAVSQSTTVVKRRRDPESPLPSVPQRPRNFFDIALNSNLNTRSFYTSSEQQDQQISARLVDAFERIKNDALSVRLLSILRILGRCPGRWFERATSPRQRWNDKGELESHLPDFCQLHSLDIPGAMDLLLDNGLIIRDQEGCLALPPALKEYVVDHLPDQGAIRVCALLLTCHLFPGDKNIDSWYVSPTSSRPPLLTLFSNRSDGTLLLDPLQRIIPFLPSMLEQRLLVREEEYIVIETILYASRFPSPVTGSAAQFDNLDAADNMLLRWPDHSLRLFAAIRRKALSRLCHGTVWKEPGVLLRLAPANPRINALQWELRLSRAQDHVENDDWDGARTEVSNFAPFQSNKVSTMERCQETEIQTHLSRFLYLAGRFGATLQLLQRMDASVNPKDEIIHTSHLAGAMCELGDPLGAIEITRTKLKGSSSTRLRVLFAECLLHYGMALCDTSSHIPKEAQSSFNESKQICDGIMASFETIPNFFRGQAKQDDRVCYLRTATVVARICTLEAIFGEGNLKDARCSWISALYAVRNCRWRRTGYMEGICHFTLAFIGIWESPVAETLNCDLEMAERYISRAGFRHLIIGMGPLWYNLIHKLALRKGDRRFRLAALTSL